MNSFTNILCQSDVNLLRRLVRYFFFSIGQFCSLMLGRIYEVSCEKWIFSQTRLLLLHVAGHKVSQIYASMNFHPIAESSKCILQIC